MSDRSRRYRATWNGTVLAESDDVVLLEGNVYFPPEALVDEHFAISRGRSLCPWKGIARYYDVVVDGSVNRGAAWTYHHPTPLARRIRHRVAFWQGVQVDAVR
jgi:uncharacterized protein (DUF427 family)